MLERLVAAKNMAAVRLDSDLPTLVDLLPQQAKVRRRVLRAVEKLVGPRRHEMVYFHPHELAARRRAGSGSLASCLRELNQLEAFTYVPPFRGRGDPHAPAATCRSTSWRSTSTAIERRKAAEYEKLNRVIRFAAQRTLPAAGDPRLLRRERARAAVRPLRQLPPPRHRGRRSHAQTGVAKSSRSGNDRLQR